MLAQIRSPIEPALALAAVFDDANVLTNQASSLFRVTVSLRVSIGGLASVVKSVYKRVVRHRVGIPKIPGAGFARNFYLCR